MSDVMSCALNSNMLPPAGSQLGILTSVADAASACSAPVRDYVAGALSENTHRAYYSDLEHFRVWGGSIPTVPPVVAEYLAAHALINSVATLKRRLATIAKAHRIIGVESPTKAELVRATLRGIQRKHGKPQLRAAPLTKEILFEVLQVMDSDLKSIRDKAILLLGFAGALRRSELSQLDFTDIEWQVNGLYLTLKRSKTDQEGVGRIIAIPIGSTKWCPVIALKTWVARTCITDGPLFRPIEVQGRLSHERLSGEAISILIKKRVAAAGLNPKSFSGHSLRAGFATSASLADVPGWRIRQQTGHSSDQMLTRYIRWMPTFSDNPNCKLL